MTKLNIIAKRLELLEDTLIYRFLERAQFAAYPQLYRGGDSLEEILRHSLLGQRLQAHETMELQFGRYSVAEEFSFSPVTWLPEAEKKPLSTSLVLLQKLGENQDAETYLPLSLLELRQISQCQSILQHYLDFLPRYCHNEDGPPQYGSALECDVMALQALSRRIHYGAIYVAEEKFCEQETVLRPLILQWQREGSYASAIGQQILTLLTRPEVEQNILQRVYEKSGAIQQNGARYYLAPEALRDFYADCVIPLTKRGELAYLYRRV